MTIKQARPWYCRDRVVDEYKQSLTTDEEPFSMLKKLKIARAILVNTGVFLLTAYLAYLGGDPTILGVMSLSLLAGYNGLEMSDYMALLRAYNEVQKNGTNTDE